MPNTAATLVPGTPPQATQLPGPADVVLADCGHCSRDSGGPAADVADLERLIVALGRLAVDVPEIAELDLNPVMVGATECSLVDVRLRLANTDDPGPGTPRQLRRID